VRVTDTTIEDKAIDLEHVRLHYAEIISDQSPIVLLHGIGVDWRVWQAVYRRLAAQGHLYMVDLRGHGDSSKPRVGYRLPDYADDIEGLIAGLGLTDVTLVGSSLGGLVALVLNAASKTVSRRILVDPPLKRGPGRLRPLFLQIQAIKRAAEPADSDLVRAQILPLLREHSEGAGELLLRYMADTWSRTAIGVIDEALASADSFDSLEATLTKIESPTLIMRGNPRLGSVLDEETARYAVDLLPHGEELYFPESGHAIHGSSPVAFTEAVRRFQPMQSNQVNSL
jgi:pimeloyl-ACP methyl ester carboxylesterase